jgi:hypothetical protein
VLKNRVRENIEILKKEQLNADYLENMEKLDDWPRQDVITVEKNSVILDFLVADLNHDSVPDVVMAVKHKDGTCTIVQILFSSTSKMVYTVQELRFDNPGIVQLLAVHSFDSSKYSVIFLSNTGSLMYMVNRDPLYSAVQMVSLDSDKKVGFFLITDLNGDNKADFIIGVDGKALWLYQNNENRWTLSTIIEEGVIDGLFASVSAPGSSDLFLLYADRISWAITGAAKGKHDKFSWEKNGDIETFHFFTIEAQQKDAWSRFRATVTYK